MSDVLKYEYTKKVFLHDRAVSGNVVLHLLYRSLKSCTLF
jgi:hypothetical protein